MEKYTLSQPLREILYLQDLRANKDAYKFAMPGYSGGHPGNDINFGDGDQCLAFYDSTVVCSLYDTLVLLTFPDNDGNCIEYHFAHMSDQLVKPGDHVKKGQLVGHQGSVGPTIQWIEDDKQAWSHLHYGWRLARPGKLQQDLLWNYPALSVIPYHIVEYDKEIDHFRDPNELCHRVLHRVAMAVERKENFRKYHAETNNPGNIRGLSGKFLMFPTYEAGFTYLRDDYLFRAVSGKHPAYLKWGKTMTIYQFCQTYAPKTDGNDPLQYAKDIVQWCGFRSIHDLASDWLLTELEWARKYNNAELIVYPPQLPITEIEPERQAMQREMTSIFGIIAKILKQWWGVKNKD